MNISICNEYMYMSVEKVLISNSFSVRLQCLKLFNSVQTNDL